MELVWVRFGKFKLYCVFGIKDTYLEVNIKIRLFAKLSAKRASLTV